MSVSNNLNVRLVHAAKTINAWANINVVPILGEVCLVADSTSAPMKYKIKIGDGNRYVAKIVGGVVVDEEDTSDGGILPYFGDFDNLDVNTFQLVAITPGKKNPSDTENNKTTVTFKGIKEVDGKIQVDNTSVLNLEIDGVYDSSNPTKWLVTKDTAVSMISDAINSLDGSATASSSSVLTGVVEANGIISKSSEVSYTTIAPVQNVTTSDTGDSGLDVTTSTNTKDVHHKDVNSQRESTAPTSEGVVPVIMGSVDNYGHVSGEVVSSDKIIAADIKAPVTRQDNSTWNHRVTGGDISIGEDIAKIPSLKGNTIVWNQALADGLLDVWSAKSYTKNNHEFTVVSNSLGNAYLGKENTTVTGHHYYVCSEYKAPVQGTKLVLFGGGSRTIINDNNWHFFRSIITATESTFRVGFVTLNIEDVSSEFRNCYIIDLTKMFGSDDQIAAALGVANLTDSTNLTKAAENFEKLFPNSYYPYCEGRLVNLGGYGVKMNQLVKTSELRGGTESGITFTNNNDGTVSVSGTATAAVFYGVNVGTTPQISGHKYYCTVGNKISVNTSPGITRWWTADISTSQAIYTNSTIYTAANSTTVFSFGIGVSNGIVCSGTLIPQVIDLTLMFGAGNEPTLEECEQIFTEDYYEYNAGTEMNIFDVATGENKLGLESTGFNLWDEEPLYGVYSSSDGYTFIPQSNFICSKNFIPVSHLMSYYFTGPNSPRLLYYDEDKAFTSTVTIDNNSTFTPPVGAVYMRWQSGNDGDVYRNNVCINLSDPSRNGQYEPYKSDTLDLDWVREIEYTPEGSSTPEKLFPYGLLSAGNVHDEIHETYAIKRVNKAVVQKTGFSLWGENAYYKAIAPVDGKYGSNSQTSNLVSNHFIATYANYLYNNNVPGLLAISGTGNLYISADDYNNTNITSIEFYYELATPVRIDYPANNMSYLVDDLGTEAQSPVNPSNAAPITAPFVGTFEYKSNFKDAIRDLFDKVNNAVNPVKGKDNTSQTVGKLAIYDSSETVKSSIYEPSNATIVEGATGNDIILPSVEAIVNYVQSVLSSALTYKGTVGTESALYTHESDASDGDLWIASQTIVVNNDPETTVANGTYYPGTFFIWNEDHWDTVASSVSVDNNDVLLTFNSTERLTIGTINGTNLTLRQPNLNFSDPTASSNALSFIDSVSQTNGLLSATKKTVQSATSQRLGVVQAAYDSSSASPLIVPQSSASNRNYGLQTNANGLAFTNVPWTDSTYKLTVNGTVNGDNSGTSLGTIYTPTATGSQYDLLTADSNGYPIWSNLDLTNSGLLKFDGTGWTLDTNSYITSAVTVLDSIMQNGTPITDSNLSAGLKVIKDGTTSYKKISFAAITNDTSTGNDAVTIILNGNFS